MNGKSPKTHPPQPANPPDGDMLTPSEIEQLRREAKEADAYFQKAFAHLKPVKT